MSVSSPPFSSSSLSSDSEIYNVSSPDSPSEGRPKPRRMRCKNPSKQRRNASEKEKLRMRDLTKALHNLRMFLPSFVAPAGQTLTKIETLRLAIRYISYLSSQLDLHMSCCHNAELRPPHHGSTSHSQPETFLFPQDKPPHSPFYKPWTRTEKTLVNAEGDASCPQRDATCAHRLYGQRLATLQGESRFLRTGTEQRDGIKLEIPDCDELFDALMTPQTALSQQVTQTQADSAPQCKDAAFIY